MSTIIDALTTKDIDEWMQETWQLYSSIPVGPPGQRRLYRLWVAVGRKAAKVEYKDLSITGPPAILYEGDIYVALERFRDHVGDLV